MKFLLMLYMSLFFNNNNIINLPNEDFNFWIGKWNVSWEGGSGTNNISLILNEKIISEEFIIEKGSNAGYKGISHTAYNKNIKKWQQTWVDNQGAYLDFIGEKVGDKMILSRTAVDQEGNKLFQRMIFFDIQKDSFKWDWQKSNDDKNWNSVWQISYQRIKE